MIFRLLLLLMMALSLVALEGCATTQTSSKKKRVKKSKKQQKLPGGSTHGPVVATVDGMELTAEDLEELDADVDDEEEDDDKELTSVVAAEGGASFYHDSLAGRLTANGEKYNPGAKTCAHKTLPFGTVVVVEDTDTGKSTRCRINDRGPYIGGRIIDLSKRVAQELGIIEKGVARVRIRIVRHTTS